MIIIQTRFVFLVNRSSTNYVPPPKRWLFGDCGLIIIAGSDTTTTALTYVFYHLCQSAQIFAKLRKELDSFYKPGSESEFRDLQEATYLNAVINEALRLHPPVPSGLLRVTPPEGITIGSTFIPGNVTISTPFYSMGRRKCILPFQDFKCRSGIAAKQWRYI